MPPGEAVIGVRKDLLDAYQARLDDLRRGGDRGRREGLRAAPSPRTPRSPRATGRSSPASSRRSARRPSACRPTATSRRWPRRPSAATRRPSSTARDSALEDIDGFTAAPFTPDEQARRAQQLTRFLDLIPVEYDRGTEDGEVTLAFEIQEAVAFSEGARAAFSDIESTLIERDPAGVETVNTALAELDRISNEANEGGEVASQDEIESVHDDASSALEEMSPEEWTEGGTEADFDLVEISLDQMEAAVGAGEREQAEQARLSAYAFFEFGPERLLRALDPQLVTEVEGLVWYGAAGEQGLAELIASDDTTSRDVRETRLALDERLEDAREVTGEGASGVTVITNAALIVFREGLEAILIIAAITASMVGANRRLRKPGPARRPARPARQRDPLRDRRPAARPALAVRREAGGDRRPGGRGHPLTRPQLVLPQGLLDRVDLEPPQAEQGAHRRRGRRRGRRRDRARPLHARLHERLPRGLRDRALPPGPPARVGHRASSWPASRWAWSAWPRSAP